MLSLGVAGAQTVPPVINYQGHLMDQSGDPINGNVTMVFSIFDAATGDTALYSETQTVAVNDGVFHALIGSVTPLPQTLFDTVPPAGFLEITVNGDVISRRTRFGSVAYAFNSGSGNITSVNAGAGLAASATTGAVTLSIADEGVTSNKISDGAITANKVAMNAVGSDEIATDAVGSSEITANAVGSSEIAAGAVGSSEIAAGAVGSSEIAAEAVTSSKIADGAVGSSELANFIDLGEAGAANGNLQVFSSAASGSAVEVETHSSGVGELKTFNENGGQVTALTTALAAGTSFFDTEKAGFFGTLGPNGKYNGMLATLVDFPNRGYVSVWDAQALRSVPNAGMYVDDNGHVFGDTKNFRMSHPRTFDQEIWYASVEGPEAAAYVRGTARLRDGVTTISFPEHFQIVANAEGMTVLLTPLDAASKGLAVIAKSAAGIEVRELRQGAGNYDFDWEVKCVRKGRENYRVLRNTLEASAAETRPATRN